MGAMENVIENREDRLPAEAREILQSLASQWEDVVDSKALQVIPLKGAMTNEVFEIKWPAKTGELSRKVVVRIYGEGVDVFFDRDNEIRTFEYMSKNGQGPRLLGRFPNGRIEEFIHARVLSCLLILLSFFIKLIIMWHVLQKEKSCFLILSLYCKWMSQSNVTLVLV